MENILIINHSVENCGVYQYGKRVADILINSKVYNFIYLEIDSAESMLESISQYSPSLIIYNHLSGTMPWATKDFIENIRSNLNIKQGTIVHNSGHANFFDFYLHQDPNYQSSGIDFNLLRPLFSKYENPNTTHTNTIKIGSFGFGFRSKFYPDICRIVNSQASDFERIDLNLHLTSPHFCESALHEIIPNCKTAITNQNISLNITSNFLSTNELLNFLGSNDLNIFLYQNYWPEYNGISSVIDYALSVKKPIAICRSNMFSHIWNSSPSICVEEMSLKSILQNGTVPLEQYYEKWSNENFISHVENIIDLLLR